MTRATITGVPPATTSYAGLLSAADKATLNNYFHSGFANILDYGGDPTGTNDNTAAFNAAIATLAGGGTVWVPPGTYKLSGTVTIPYAGIHIVGASRNNSIISTNSTTADMFLVNGWYANFYDLTLTTSVTRTAGYAINAPTGYDYCIVRHCYITASSSATHYNCINMSNLLMIVDDCQFQNWSNIMINLAAGSVANQYVSNILASNAVQAVSGISIQSTGSLMIADSDIVNAGNALDVIPATGVSIPSIEAINTFFDTSVNGVRFNAAGTGNVVRCKFTNCWFGSHTNSGVNFYSVGGGIDGITFVNCDYYGCVNGILCNAAPNNWQVSNSRFAGNSTAAINIAATSTAHYPQIFNNYIGSQAGFGVNGTGIIVAAGSYAGLKIANNTVLGNTTAFTLGAVTATAPANYAIHDNPGINPRGAVTQPAVPATGVAATNTTGFYCQIFQRAGTETAVTINGVATGITAAPSTTGTFLTILPPGGTIALTYTVAPTWVWIAN